jgi:hypothetical protein
MPLLYECGALVGCCKGHKVSCCRRGVWELSISDACGSSASGLVGVLCSFRLLARLDRGVSCESERVGFALLVASREWHVLMLRRAAWHMC